MKAAGEINSLVSDEEITLYWEKEKKGGEYRIFCNEQGVGITSKTYFTIKGLEPETTYQVRVLWEKAKAGMTEGERTDGLEQVTEGERTDGLEQLTEGERTDSLEMVCQVKTGKRKKKITVTEAPYFAKGDGVTMNTEAIQQALDACSPEEMVVIPAGIFMTGALRLHSDMELYLEKGAILQGTDRIEDYLPRIWSRFEGTEMECYSSLLNLGELNHESGFNCRNVVIRGQGTIASGGQQLAQKIIASETAKMAEELARMGDRLKECEKPETVPGRVRPRLVNMSNCQNIRLSGVTFKNGASWNVHMIYSENIVTDGCQFFSEGVWNGDGWDPDSSVDCTIFDCVFHTGDDAIAIKSGKNPEGNQIARPCRKIRIFDCHSAFGHGITIGSEMSGGIEDVKIWDCDMGRSMCGIEIKGTRKRGGYVRNIQVADSTVSRISMHSVGYNDDGEGWKEPPVFADCLFEDLCIYGEYLGDDRDFIPCDAIELAGFDAGKHAVRNIVFRNISLGRKDGKKKQTLALQLCDGVTIQNLSAV